MDSQLMFMKAIFGLALAVIGYGILVITNWQIAIGVFLVIWSANIENSLKDKEDN